MGQYIEPQQRSGYLRFLTVLLIVAYFVPAIWGMMIGFAWVLLVGGVPVFVGRWLVEKYFELNRTADAEDDQRADEDAPWWLDQRRERFRRN